MDSKNKSLHQKLIDDPKDKHKVIDNKGVSEPRSFPLPHCSSVEERFMSMSKDVVQLDDSGIVDDTPFTVSGNKSIYHVRHGDPDEWKTIKVLSLETFKILKTFLLFDPKSDHPEIAEASFEHFS